MVFIRVLLLTKSFARAFKHGDIRTAEQQIPVLKLVSRPVSSLDVGEIFTFTFALWFQHRPTARHCYKLLLQRAIYYSLNSVTAGVGYCSTGVTATVSVHGRFCLENVKETDGLLDLGIHSFISIQP